MDNRVKKGISIALDVLLILVMGLVLFVSVNAIVSKDKGYTSLFGSVVYAVETDSMKGDYKDSFDKNALIFGRELKTSEEKKSVKVGSVITFWFLKDGQRKLNTHRVVGILDENGSNHQYITKGDNRPTDNDTVIWSDVVALYESKIDGLGAVVLFAQSSSGFFVVAVLPSILLFAYCVVLFYSSIKKALDKKHASNILELANKPSEQELEELRRQIRLEIEAENKKED